MRNSWIPVPRNLVNGGGISGAPGFEKLSSAGRYLVNGGGGVISGDTGTQEFSSAGINLVIRGGLGGIFPTSVIYIYIYIYIYMYVCIFSQFQASPGQKTAQNTSISQAFTIYLLGISQSMK